jgi:hypothetical protein
MNKVVSPPHTIIVGYFFKSSHENIKFGYAVQSCFIKLGGNFLVDGYNSFCGEYNQNQNISTGSVAYVNEIKINGRNVNITGQVVSSPKL